MSESPQLIPPSVLLMGASGAGKTSALTTFIPEGIETFVVCTEPGGHESLLDWCQQQNFDIDKLHWAYALPSTQGWDSVEDLAKKISAMNFELLASIKSGVGKEATRKGAERLIGLFKNFRCERTGKEYGDVTTWGPDRAFCLDSLSGLSEIAWALTVGYKPTAHQGEWNIAMNFVHDIVRKLNTDRRCFFVLTAHIEKNINEITGISQIMVATLGRKLAPRLPQYFSEVVYAQRTNSDPKFRWSTLDNSAELKNRGLPVGDKLPPNFHLVVESYRRRVEMLKKEASSRK